MQEQLEKNEGLINYLIQDIYVYILVESHQKTLKNTTSTTLRLVRK